MSDQMHFVVAGDSPQAISKKYGIAWTTIYDHPKNAFMKQRKGYPIYPGDKLVVPRTTTLPPNVYGPVAPVDFSVRFRDFLSIVEWNMKMLDSLTARHPSASKATVHPTPLPKKDPGIPAAKAGEIVGYQKSLPGVRGGVTLTAPIESAYTVLRPLLPGGTVMTSGLRSDAQQANIINDYFAKFKGPAEITDVEKRRQWVLALTDDNGKNLGIKIAAVGSSPHRTGLAFDLSGADLDLINNAVTQCSKNNPTTFPLHRTIVERNPKQNCVHVEVKY